MMLQTLVLWPKSVIWTENEDTVYEEIQDNKLTEQQIEEIFEYFELITQNGFIPSEGYF